MQAITADPQVKTSSRPRLVTWARLKFDAVRMVHMVLLPEIVITLNETAAGILAMCDGHHRVSDIVSEMREAFADDDAAILADVSEFIATMTNHGVLELHS